jgi:F420-dependent oxidoreductase-like protein
MQLGIHFVNFTLPGQPATLAKMLGGSAVAADEGGCATFTLMDHWFQMQHLAPAQDPMLEGYTGLGYVAALTNRVRIGLLVTGVTYRHPGLLAKTVTTLDVLSEGRATLGLGAAWYEREHNALGVPFPRLAERFERLEEALQICLQMWSDDDGPYNGTHYQLAETICSPRPIQQPRPPILIGGSGERKTLKLVARYADACNLFATSVPEIGRKIDVLARHCDNENRDLHDIQITILGGGDPIGNRDAFVSTMEEYARLGVELVEVVPSGPDPEAFVTEMCEHVIPRLAQF